MRRGPGLALTVGGSDDQLPASAGLGGGLGDPRVLVRERRHSTARCPQSLNTHDADCDRRSSALGPSACCAVCHLTAPVALWSVPVERDATAFVAALEFGPPVICLALGVGLWGASRGATHDVAGSVPWITGDWSTPCTDARMNRAVVLSGTCADSVRSMELLARQEARERAYGGCSKVMLMDVRPTVLVLER